MNEPNLLPHGRVAFQSQAYEPHWAQVLMSERAKARIAEMTILYAAFGRALNRTLADVLDQIRLAPPKESKIEVAEVVALDDVPSGIKMSYTVSSCGLMVCDFWTPPQPQLFGVETGSGPKRKR